MSHFRHHSHIHEILIGVPAPVASDIAALVVDVLVIAAFMGVVPLSAVMMQNGADAQALANVRVAEPPEVPVQVIVPMLSLLPVAIVAADTPNNPVGDEPPDVNLLAVTVPLTVRLPAPGSV